ncbi:hypothetical protein ACLB2K_004695 [Fragaria x ananassa]
MVGCKVKTQTQKPHQLRNKSKQYSSPRVESPPLSCSRRAHIRETRNLLVLLFVYLIIIFGLLLKFSSSSSVCR